MKVRGIRSKRGNTYSKPKQSYMTNQATTRGLLVTYLLEIPVVVRIARSRFTVERRKYKKNKGKVSL